MIVRTHYLEKLKQYQKTEFIKIISGVRRAGKSFLLKLFYEELLSQGVPKSQIFFLNFESFKDKKYTNIHFFYKTIEKQIDSKQKVYFLLDEIQEVEDWQRLVNGLRVDFDSDIYLTGSNASLLSGEMATYLAGRYVELKIYPLSFKEFLIFKGSQRSIDEQFWEYVEHGGFPSAVLQSNVELRNSVISGILDSIVLKDVALRGKLSDEEVLTRVIDFMFDNVGQTISPNKIANTFISNGIKTNNKSIDKYLYLLENAFVLYKAKRYDIRGKERLKTLAKYFVVDTGLRNRKLGKTYRDNQGNQIENIVYMELKRRGYELFVGKYNQVEIDFVAMKAGIIEYYQVTRQIPNNTHESDNLLHLPDNYQKTIITANRMDVGNIGGIEVVYITDFLLEW